MLYLASSQQAGAVFTQKDAADTALRDASDTLAKSYGQTERYVDVISASYEAGKWRVVFDVTIAPHSHCPEVQRFTYEMFPIMARNETLVSAKECYARPITRKSDAIIDSYANSAQVRGLASNGYLACAFQVPIANAYEERTYCYFLDDAGLSSFASKNSLSAKTWVVQWSVPGKASHFVALDESGSIIAQTA